MRIFKTILATAFASALVTTVLATAAYSGGKKDIVDTAIDAGQFETLVAAAKAAGIFEALKGEGPFTIFAPTDAAFEALPEGAVESLLQPENKDRLAAIQKLDEQARDLELAASSGAGTGRHALDKHIRSERAAAPVYGGRTVFDPPREEN
jgi:hypothetical protein